MMTSARFAIVTPYFREDPVLLKRCIDSVARQDARTEHILVADGHPQRWIDGEPVRHLVLDRPHADYGNTPRGIGAVLAISGEYAGIGFLDADNWLEADHVSLCARTAAAAGDCDFVVARRRFRRPDESVIDVDDEPPHQHVDTNCFFLLPGSFFAAPHFATMPKQLAAIGDRIFYMVLSQWRLRAAIVDKQTVNYHCLWRSIYAAAGEAAPAGAKANVDTTAAERWLGSLSPRQRQIVGRLCGERG